jgi:hypothetical protein
MIQANKSNSQLVAHCFFAQGMVEYQNYDLYNEEKEIRERIEADNDY